MNVELKKWQLLSQQWESSGLAQKIFCESKGISYSTFTNRRSKLIKQGLATSTTVDKTASNFSLDAFVPLVSKSDLADNRMIEIKLPFGIVLKVPADDGVK